MSATQESRQSSQTAGAPSASLGALGQGRSACRQVRRPSQLLRAWTASLERWT